MSNVKLKKIFIQLGDIFFQLRQLHNEFLVLGIVGGIEFNYGIMTKKELLKRFDDSDSTLDFIIERTINE